MGTYNNVVKAGADRQGLGGGGMGDMRDLCNTVNNKKIKNK